MSHLEKYYDLDNVLEDFPQKITPIRCGDELYYLKRRVEDKYWRKKIMRFVQKVLVSLFGLKELAPTANVRQSSSYEPRKIIALGEQGIPVPKVCYFNDDYFIMSDCGVTLQSYIRHNPEEAELLLSKSIQQLARLHNSGHAHGGSQIRNFAVNEGEIFLFDFEEIIPEKYCENIQFRDILVFLISLSRVKGIDFNYKELLSLYEECAEKKGSTQKIIDLARKFSWLGHLPESCCAKLFGRDVYRISILIQQILRADKKQDLVSKHN